MGNKGRIRFRCWYCNRKHVAGWDQVGDRRVCNCGQRYRVPRRDGISKGAKTVLDWILEFVIYGGGGAFLCGLLGFAITSRLRSRHWETYLLVIGGAASVGFLVGALFGERGINRIGELFDDRRTPGE
jgi:hypothetical protein